MLQFEEIYIPIQFQLQNKKAKTKAKKKCFVEILQSLISTFFVGLFGLPRDNNLLAEKMRVTF